MNRNLTLSLWASGAFALAVVCAPVGFGVAQAASDSKIEFLAQQQTTPPPKKVQRAAPPRQAAPNRAATTRQAAPRRAAPQRQAAPTRAAPNRQAAPRRATSQRQVTRTRAVPKRQATTTRVAPKRQATTTRVAPKRQATTTRVAPKRQATTTRVAPARRATPTTVLPQGARVTASRLRGVPARGVGRAIINGQNYSAYRRGYRVRRGNGWATFVALSALGAVAIGTTQYYPYAYISAPAPTCEGYTEDGCQLTWREVETVEGGVVSQCVAYCPWQ